MTMLTEKFDAYGAVLPEAARGKREPGAEPAVLGRIGQSIFWLLVILIVSARIIWYPASPSFDAGSATDVKQAATR
jgi:hypothetical protein